jgi:hypothetical protein
MEKNMSEQQSDPAGAHAGPDILLSQYHEIHENFRTAFALYLKGISFGAAWFAVTTGYLLSNNPLPLSLRRAGIVTVGLADVLIAIVYWWCIRYSHDLHESMMSTLREVSGKLGLEHRDSNYQIFPQCLNAARYGGSAFLLGIAATCVYLFIRAK